MTQAHRCPVCAESHQGRYKTCDQCLQVYRARRITQSGRKRRAVIRSRIFMAGTLAAALFYVANIYFPQPDQLFFQFRKTIALLVLLATAVTMAVFR